MEHLKATFQANNHYKSKNNNFFVIEILFRRVIRNAFGEASFGAYCVVHSIYHNFLIEENKIPYMVIIYMSIYTISHIQENYKKCNILYIRQLH